MKYGIGANLRTVGPMFFLRLRSTRKTTVYYKLTLLKQLFMLMILKTDITLKTQYNFLRLLDFLYF